MRSTLNDVAREAGVSPATVDRVLNNRTGVRTRTREIVVETARRLGYISPAPDDAGRQPSVPDEVVKLNFALPAGTNTFIKMLHREIEAQALLRPNLDVHVEAIEGFDPDGLARALLDLRGKTQGVGVIALDHPTVREAIRSLAADGVKVVTIASDILHVPRVAYVGIDNRAAGRLAGYLVGRFMRGGASGKAAVFAGSRSYRGHEEREIGFLHLIESTFPQLRVIGLREGQDDSERNYMQTRKLLEQYPDLAGIYNSGGGSDGVARAILEAKADQKILFIGHGLTPDTRALLIDGTMDALITQTPQSMVANCLKIFRNVRDQRSPLDGVKPIQFSIVLRENLP